MIMCVIFVTLLFGSVSSIRVPSSWDDFNRFRTIQLGGSETTTSSAFRNLPRHHQPYGVVGFINNNNRRHSNVKPNDFRFQSISSDQRNDWVPITNPIYRNYRDDRTYESESHENEPKIQRTVEEPPSGVPTKPIYPGEGQWAVRGEKFRPFISKHQFSQLKNENDHEDEAKPEGYDVFERNENIFKKQYDNFRGNLDNFPKKHKLESAIHEDPSEPEEDDEEESEEDSEEFVPIKVYSQVRKTENEEHLPSRHAEDPRLREVVKDSKIQTVYTEEGYEDEAYDHEGHEKNAEESEGDAEFAKDSEKENDAEAAGSEYGHKAQPVKKMRKNNLLQTEETKTTQIKNQDDGRRQFEISSEIKVLMTPNNSTKAHRFIKIFPKTYRYDQYQTKTTTAQPQNEETTVVPKIIEEIANVTEIRANQTERSEPEPLESVTESIRKRIKRFTSDLTVDTEFISKIAEENAKPLSKIIKKYEKPKYPYYNNKQINPLSPLRYSEDLDDIPPKDLDDLAFYNQASQRVKCEEVESDVDPIPERVKNAEKQPKEMDDSTDVQNLIKGPRLENLGDKIDCFKLKFWGEDPLDNPIFKEKEVEPVQPIFNFFQSGSNKQEVVHGFEKEVPKSETSKNRVENPTKMKIEDDLKVNISNDVIVESNESQNHPKSTTALPKIDTSTTTEVPTITIITTPKYTIALKPKHIYDQIQLLDHLPGFKAMTVADTNSSRVGKTLDESTSPILSGESTNEDKNDGTPSATLPESQALLRRRHRKRIRPHNRRRRPYYIFDINRFIPPPPGPRYNYYQQNRGDFLIPKQSVLSEVHYKQEINPDEQIAVFSDVINNIKGSHNSDLKGASSMNFRIPLSTSAFYLTTSTTIKPIAATKKVAIKDKNKDEIYDDLLDQYDNLEILKVGASSTRKPKKKVTTTTTEPYEDHESDPTEMGNEDEAPLGLMPPDSNRYHTIYSPAIDNNRAQEHVKSINHFLVVGMKPPSPHQKIHSYSDYKFAPKVVLRRYKRSRPGYSEVVRNRNKPIDLQDDDKDVIVVDDDGYVPHRSKNYHYDEKTGKIVYDNPPASTNKEEVTEEEEEEMEYVEVTEKPIRTKPNRRNQVTTPRFVIDPNEPPYTDFVQKLRSNPNYVPLPDPTTTTTEKGVTVETTNPPVVTTGQPTNPPEFLSILAKVKHDPSYKSLEDEKKTPTTTTTTENPEEEEEAEETQQNSPGGQLLKVGGSNFQIFDISEYLPKIKNYAPRTAIDTTKYKTIERPTVRHNLSSRYNQDEPLDDVNTMRIPIVTSQQLRDDEESNPEMSESKVEEREDEIPSTTTTTRKPSSTVRSRIKSRVRGRPTTTTTSTTKRPSRATTISSPVEEYTPAPHVKAKRIYRTRRPIRVRIKSTTDGTSSLMGEESEDTTKIVRRRHQTNSKNVPTPQKNEDGVTATPSKKPRRVDSDVVVFQKFDETKKHGGNYKKEETNQEEDGREEIDDKDADVEESGNDEVKRLTDVIPKPIAFYTDPKLPKNVNQLIENGTSPLRINLNESDEEDGDDDQEETEHDDYDEEGGSNEEKSTENEENVKKTAQRRHDIIIKEPGERLYYYAPI